MKLPNMSAAFIEPRKITAYLLAEENSGGKSGFFARCGFTSDAWEQLGDALLQHAEQHSVTRVMPSSHGTKYIIEGAMQTPDGRSPNVRSVWIVDAGQSAPRLVTAYPVGG